MALNDPAGGQAPVALVLAAGQGTRMRSAVPKVLHEVAGRPLIDWVLQSARDAGCARILVVVGHGAEAVREAAAAPDVTWVLQEEQRGTGDAVASAAGVLEGATGTVLVLSGDVPLVKASTLATLLESAAQGWGAMAVAEVEVPGSLGRVRCSADGGLEAIIEVVDAGEEDLAIRLVNAGVYALPVPELFPYLERLVPSNRSGELYLTDALVAAARSERITCVRLADPSEAWGVNDRADLARVHLRMLQRYGEELMASGVTLLDPSRIVVQPSVRVGPDTVLHPDVTLLGSTEVGSECEIHQGAWLRDTVLASGVVVNPYSVLDGARVGSSSELGPFARLRPGAELDEQVKIGNFVEVKKSRLGRGSKASHLAYLGDATLGPGVNIGAGTVTCNYDGFRKHRTEIGEGAFIGSDTMLVAPVKVGARALTAAGSVITKDVPDEALAVGRARQKTRADGARVWRERQQSEIESGS